MLLLKNRGEHREENDRIIRSLQERKKDKGLLEMKVHGKDSLVTYEIYDKSGIMVYETMPLDELSNDPDDDCTDCSDHVFGLFDFWTSVIRADYKADKKAY